MRTSDAIVDEASFFHQEFERVGDPTQLISKNFYSIFFIEGTPDSLVTPGGMSPEPIHDSHSIISKSALGGQAFLELGNGMSTDSALASEASIIRAELLFHQNRPPRMARASSFAKAARTSRYTASPSPGSEPSLWMHSMR